MRIEVPSYGMMIYCQPPETREIGLYLYLVEERETSVGIALGVAPGSLKRGGSGRKKKGPGVSSRARIHDARSSQGPFSEN
jgi:hypothetical protein